MKEPLQAGAVRISTAQEVRGECQRALLQRTLDNAKGTMALDAGGGCQADAVAGGHQGHHQPERCGRGDVRGEGAGRRQQRVDLPAVAHTVAAIQGDPRVVGRLLQGH